MAYTLVPTELIVDGAITSAKLDTNLAISGTLGVTGEVTLATHLNMGNNDKIKLGASGLLEIYHDSSNGYISNSTGNLYIGDTNGNVHIQAKLNEDSIVAAADGAVTLYHDNSAKLATSSAGVSVTGNATFADNGKAVFGTGSDLQIHHDGTNNLIQGSAGVVLYIQAKEGENSILAVPDGAVTLYHDNSAKLATASGGVTVTGTLTATTLAGNLSTAAQTNITSLGTLTTLTVDDITINGSTISDAGDLTFDVGGDIILDADGGDFTFKDGGTTQFQLQNSSGDVQFVNNTEDKDIKFMGDDGGSTITALTLDMSAAGRATFNADVIVPRYIEHASDTDTFIGFSADNTFDITVGAVEVAKFTSSEVVINEDSADVDFRVESNGNANMLFVDGGNDTIGIGVAPLNNNLSPALQFASGGTMFGYGNAQYITGNTYFDGSWKAIATGGGSNLVIDNAGFKVYNNASASANAAISPLLHLTVGLSEMVVNDDSNDYDFRVESNGNTHMLFVDGGNNVVSVGGTPVETSDHFEVLSSDTTTNLRVRNTNAGSAAPALIFDKSSGSPADDDEVGLLNFVGQDSANNAEVYAQIVGIAADVTSGTEDGTLTFGTKVAGTFATRMSIVDGGTILSGDASINRGNQTSGELLIGGTTDGGFVDFDGSNLQLNTQRDPNTGTFINTSKSHGGITISGGDADSHIRFFTASANNTTATERVRIHKGGVASFANGIELGSGLDATAANTLDDYEEGTWTPNLRDSSGNSVGQSGQTGHYTKIGNLVYVIFAISVNDPSSAGNGLQIQALPFTVENVSSGSGEPSGGQITFANNMTSRSTYGLIVTRANNASDLIELKYHAQGSATTLINGTNLNSNDLTTSTYMCGHCLYRT
tara:strand:+ start:78 stop:2726 length:2649 start_codon:yes stop_codon:yes gene_type:complete